MVIFRSIAHYDVEDCHACVYIRFSSCTQEGRKKVLNVIKGSDVVFKCCFVLSI